MYSRGKQHYYAAIVREAAARRAREEIPSFEEVPTVEDFTYEDIGRKSLAAFSNLLDVLSGTRVPQHTSTPAAYDSRLADQLAAVAASMDVVRRDLAAFASRTDRVLLDLLRRVETQEALTSSMPGSASEAALAPPASTAYPVMPSQQPTATTAATASTRGAARRSAMAPASTASGTTTGVTAAAAVDGMAYEAADAASSGMPSGAAESTQGEGSAAGRRTPGRYERVPKEQTRRKVLEAARELAASGRRVTLAESARMAGVAYYKAVYACKDSEELEELMDGSAV